MFLLGLGGFIHEVVTAGPERPTILLACLALMGVPVFLRKDEQDPPNPKIVPERRQTPPRENPQSLGPGESDDAR